MRLQRCHTSMRLCMITYSALFQVFNNLRNNINANYATVFSNIQYEACEALSDHSQKMSDCIPVPTEFRSLNIWKSLGVNCGEGGPLSPNLSAVTSHNSSEKCGSWNHCAKLLCLGAPTQSFCNKWSTITSQIYNSNSEIAVSPQSSKSVRSTPYGLRRERSWFFILMVLQFFAWKNSVCSHIMDVFRLWVPCD
jgi:hypothetical protein